MLSYNCNNWFPSLDGVVPCPCCFSISVYPRGNGSAEIIFNNHLTDYYITLGSCVLYRSEYDAISDSRIGSGTYIDHSFNPANQYRVECNSPIIEYIITSSQLSECPRPGKTSRNELLCSAKFWPQYILSVHKQINLKISSKITHGYIV